MQSPMPAGCLAPHLTDCQLHNGLEWHTPRKPGPKLELQALLRIPSYNHIDVRPQSQWFGITHALTELNGPKPCSISWPVQPECCQKLLQISFGDSHGQKDSARDVVIIALSENYSCKISQCYSVTGIFSWILCWGILLFSFHMGKMGLSRIYMPAIQINGAGIKN